MSVEQNKAIVRRFFEEVVNEGKLSVVDEIFAPTYGKGGPEGARQQAHVFRAAFPDIHFTVDELIAEADKVVVHVTFRGTHRGEFMGIPGTGKAVEVSGVELARLADGKIVEQEWHFMDELGFLKQAGILHHK